METSSAWFVDAGQAQDVLDRLQKGGVHTLLGIEEKRFVELAPVGFYKKPVAG